MCWKYCRQVFPIDFRDNLLVMSNRVFDNDLACLQGRRKSTVQNKPFLVSVPFATFFKNDLELRIGLSSDLTMTGPFLCDSTWTKAGCTDNCRCSGCLFSLFLWDSWRSRLHGLRQLYLRIFKVCRQIRPVFVPGFVAYFRGIFSFDGLLGASYFADHLVMNMW